MRKNSNRPQNNISEGKDKQFGLTTFALKNKTTVFVLTFLVIFLGISSYLGLPKENFPEIEQPIVYIGTPHPGNSPVDIENLVTRPIEKELNINPFLRSSIEEVRKSAEIYSSKANLDDVGVLAVIRSWKDNF